MKKEIKTMENKKVCLFALVSVLAVGSALLGSCQKEQKLEGTYKYIGWNGLTNQEEDWKLEVDDKNAYTLSLTNDFINAKNYGNVTKNDDGTYLLKHTGSADAAYPYPAIVYGFKAYDEAGTDWRCIGNFDFTAMTFTPIVQSSTGTSSASASVSA
jgi:hypothetical protein